MPAPKAASIHAPKCSGRGPASDAARAAAISPRTQRACSSSGKPVKIQLKGIRHEPRAQPHPRLALVMEPAVGAEQIVHQLVEIVVVAELHVAAEIPREARLVEDRAGEAAGAGRRFAQQPVGFAARDEAPCRSEPGRAGADNQQACGRHHACVRVYSPALARLYSAVCSRHKCPSVRCSS